MRRIGISSACIAAFFLGSCSLLQQQAPDPQPVEGEEGQAEPDADKKKANKNEGEELGGAVPSSEQQKAARDMLNEQGAGDKPTVLSDGEIPDPIGGGSAPGGRGLRMRNLVPPEEAASSSENSTPKPNSVERRGLRSPSLPKGLPMDINGKLTPNN